MDKPRETKTSRTRVGGPMDGQSDVAPTASRQVAGLRYRVNRWAGSARHVEGGEAERFPGVIRDHHLDEVLIQIAEAQERNIQGAANRVHHDIGELQTILRKGIVRIRRRNKDRLGSERRSAISRAAETKLAGSPEAGPGHIDVVARLDHRVGPHGQPLLVGRRVHLDGYGTTPGLAAVV